MTTPEELAVAAEDPVWQGRRSDVIAQLASATLVAGQKLSTMGHLIGPDRPNGESPFGHGSDAAVGVGLVAEMGARLVRSAVLLMEADERYGAAAVHRQVLEAEYLAHAFADDTSRAAAWLRASREERQRDWSPSKLRKQALDKFRPRDYWLHCDIGGHPTPEGAKALLGWNNIFPPGVQRADLVLHTGNLGGFVLTAQSALTPGADDDLTEALEVFLLWRESDPLSHLHMADTARPQGSSR